MSTYLLLGFLTSLILGYQLKMYDEVFRPQQPEFKKLALAIMLISVMLWPIFMAAMLFGGNDDGPTT